MGDIADMMLDGTLCEGCGEYLGEGDGFPQRCPGCGGESRRAARPSRTQRQNADRTPAPMNRAARAYLNEVAQCRSGKTERPSIWNSERFQACHEAGFVSYQKTSNRFRLVRATAAGLAHLEATKRTKAQP